MKYYHIFYWGFFIMTILTFILFDLESIYQIILGGLLVIITSMYTYSTRP
ncbi:MAG: hypothetical protein K9L74_00110 [Candidatus Izimaplasma sp.]|nr:hypothetical protein [Candidatus Izimaplasma bacterium]